VVRLAQILPRFVNEEENHSLMEELMDSKLEEMFHSFQNDKILGLDRWTIKLFLGLYETLGSGILRVVEGSKFVGQVLASFNNIFIAQIPKMNNPLNINDFILGSLCNYIYKLNVKVISLQLKPILS